MKCSKKIDQRFNTLLLHIRRTSFLDYGNDVYHQIPKTAGNLPKSVRGKLFVLDQAWVWVTKGLSRLWLLKLMTKPTCRHSLVGCTLGLRDSANKQPFCCLFHFRHICHIVVILYSYTTIWKTKRCYLTYLFLAFCWIQTKYIHPPKSKHGTTQKLEVWQMLFISNKMWCSGSMVSCRGVCGCFHQRFLPTTQWTMGCIFQTCYFHSI